jgi:hypothetical protein
VITIPGQTIKMDIQTGIEPVWYDKLKVLFETVSGLWIGPNGAGTAITASLSGDVNLTNVNNYFNGPAVTQGTTGTWFASGTVTCIDTSAAAAFFVKLWDGTTVIASARSHTAGLNGVIAISVSGYITNPVGNLRIDVRDASTVNGKILFNTTGLALDSTISAFRIA